MQDSKYGKNGVIFQETVLNRSLKNQKPVSFKSDDEGANEQGLTKTLK